MSESPTSRLLAPAEFWARADVRKALVEHSARELLLLFRQYNGASQQVIGAAVGMAQSHVSAIMSGRRQVTALRTWQRIADGLSIPDGPRRIIGLADSGAVHIDGIPQTATLEPPSDDLWSARRTVQDITEITLKDLMKRREALAAGGALLVGARLTETLEHWLLPHTSTTGPIRGTLGESELRQIEAATAALRHWDDRWRLGIRRKAIIGQLSEVAELVEIPQPAVIRSRLFLVMAELAKVAASMSYDSGNHPTAQKYYTLSLRAVHQAGPEHSIYGVGVLADMSRQMLDLARPHDALELSRLALDNVHAGNTPSAVLSMLRTREGWSYAQMGRAEAYHRTVVQSEELLDDSTSEQLPSWARNFDHAELSGVVGARYRDLAARQDDKNTQEKYARFSAAYIGQALQLRTPSKLRNRAFDLIGLGRTYLLLNEPAEAARIVRQAAMIEGEIGSGRVGCADGSTTGTRSRPPSIGNR